MSDDQFFIEQSAKMFEKEFDLWFSAHYAKSIKSMDKAQALELKKKVKPAFVCGLHVGLTGSIKTDLLYPMLTYMQKK